MEFILKIILIIFLILSSIANAQLYEVYDEPFEFDYKLEFNLKYEKRATSSYFDANGDVVSKISDPNFIFDDSDKLLLPEDFTRKYGFDFDQHVFEFKTIYNYSDKLSFKLLMPITISTLDEYYIYQDWFYENGNLIFDKIDKGYFTLTQVEFIEIGGIYLLYNGIFDIGLLANLRIPFGFDNSLINDNYAYLSDGATQFITGIELNFNGEKSNLSLMPMINLRSEEFQNQFVLNSKFSFTTVPMTALNVYLNYAMPLGKSSNYTFDIREFPFQEEFWDGGLGFWINFNTNFTAEFSYMIRLAGKNSYQFNLFNASIGYRL